jgi:hypothetical protein
MSSLRVDLQRALPCSNPAEPAFESVAISKLHRNGQVKVYEIINPVTGEKSQQTIRKAILDRTTGDLYLDEKEYVVRAKCLAIMLGMPFYTLSTIGWHLTKLPIVVAVVAFDALKQIPSRWCDLTLNAAWNGFREKVYQITVLSAKEVFEVVKAPFYFIAAECAACVGVVNPYLGRKWVGKVEYSWQNQRSYKEDFRKIPARPDESCWEAFVTDLIQSRAFYLAYCFQVRGNLSDKNVRLIRS